MTNVRVAVMAGVALVLTFLGVAFVGAGPRLSQTVITVEDGYAQISGPEIESDIAASQAVHSAAVAQGKIAMSVGRPIRAGMGGVRGEVVVVDANSGAVLYETAFGGVILTGVAYSPDASRVAFIKDYEELWLFDSSSERLRKLSDVASPPMRGAVLYDPKFAPSGRSVYVGVVEETFHGEDDKLDNLWKISLDGRARRVTNLTVPAGQNSQVLRGPIPLPRGRILVTIGDPADDVWRAAIVSATGAVRTLGPVPALTSAVGRNGDEILFLGPSSSGSKFDLYLHKASSWRTWCADGCEVIRSGVDSAALQPQSAG